MEAQLLVPKGFPDFHVEFGPTGVVILKFAEQISQENASLIERIFKQQQFLYPIEISFGFLPDPPKSPLPDIFGYLSTYRELRKKVGRNLATALEKDEDDWLDHRSSVLEPVNASSSNPKRSELSCLLDCSVFSPENIRNYLSIYDRVGLVLPQEQAFEGFLLSLGATAKEMEDLVAMDRIELFAPKSVERYTIPFLERMIEVRPENIHLSRAITWRTINEIRRRNPLFYPAVGIEQQRLILREMQQAVGQLPIKIQPKAAKALSKLGETWVSIPSTINQTDFTKTSGLGIVELLSAAVEFYTGKDQWLEFHLAAAPVELAAAYGSVVIPPGNREHSMANHCEIISQFYSGVPGTDVMPKPGFANFAVEELLVVSQHVPIVEFAKTFKSAEIYRFRKIIVGLAQYSQSPEEIEEAVEAFNHFVRSYESSPQRKAVWGISGFLLSTIGKATGLPFGSAILKILLKGSQGQAERNTKMASILHQLEAGLTGSFPDAIFVSKMKTKLKNKI